MLVLFRRLVTPTPDSTISPFVALNAYWDTEKRIRYWVEEKSAVDDPSEVAVGLELARYAVRPGLARVVRYGGGGEVYTQDEGVAGGPGSGGACTLAAPDITPNPAATTNGASGDAAVTVTCYDGVQPYALTLRLQNTATVLDTKTSASTAQPAQFLALNPGRYEVSVTDAVGCTRAGLFDVYGGSGDNGPYGPDLRVTYSPGAGLFRWFWNPVTKQVETFNRPPLPGESTTDDYDNKTPPGTPIDAFMLPDGYTWRVVTADGNDGVLFSNSDTRKPGLLTLHNLIIFHPDSVAEANGGVMVECEATDYPLSFQLADEAGAPLGAANATGKFEGLSPGSYEVTVTDAQGRTLAVPFSLRARYGPRWEVAHDDVHGTPYRAELWQLGYSGPVTRLIGQGEAPVEIRTDGLNGATGGQGDVPAAVGTSCVLNLRAPIGELKDVQLGGPQAFRLDVYYAGALTFRGYVTPDVYTAPLLPGLVEASLTATDGLADLKDVDFTGHVSQALAGRWPVLNTLLHCLSRTDMALPLRLLTNRWPLELASTTPPELWALTERAGYTDDKAAPLDCRTVVEALAQLLGGTLVQRGGAWEIRSALEAAGLVKARVYGPAGVPRAPLDVAAPAGTILPPTRVTGPGWRWGEASQQLSIRAGWKSLAATTDTGYTGNALPAGNVFGSDEAWNAALDALLPTAGWSENAAAPGFPLVLTRAGEKNTDLGARWPRAEGPDDARYLQSGVLPNATATEAVPWELKVTGRLVAVNAEGFEVVLPPTPGQGRAATIALEVVTDGQRPAVPLYATFVLPDAEKSADTVLTFALAPLPAQSRITRLRVSPWQGTELPGVQLLIKQIAIVLRPQGATWDGKDNFRADGPAGTVRPTEPVSVFHCDVPAKAGLFEGAAYAFRRAVSVVGGALASAWQRPGDERAAPLLESAAYDGLALRARPSRLLTGPVHYRSAPPRVLDVVDAPYDLPGRRFWVGACAWNLRQARADVSLVEIGEGASVGVFEPLASYPPGVRLLDGVTFPVGTTPLPGAGRPRVRATHHGVRVTRQA